MTESESSSPEQRIVRRLSENQLMSIRDTRGRIVSQEADFAKWMVTSLLALNSGAGFAMWSSSAVPPGYRLGATIAFVVGVLAAVSTSYFVYKANRAILENLQGWERYWISASESLRHDDEERARLDREFTAAFSKVGMTPMAGIASGVCFLFGAMIAAIGRSGGLL